jgi:hypothetical protein
VSAVGRRSGAGKPGGGPEEEGAPDKRAPLVGERERGGREEAALRAARADS